MKNSCTILCACVCVHVFVCRQGGSERGRGRREGGRERAREGDKEGGRKGGKGEEVGREGDKEGGRERDKEGGGKGTRREGGGGRDKEGRREIHTTTTTFTTQTIAIYPYKKHSMIRSYSCEVYSLTSLRTASTLTWDSVSITLRASIFPTAVAKCSGDKVFCGAHRKKLAAKNAMICHADTGDTSCHAMQSKQVTQSCHVMAIQTSDTLLRTTSTITRLQTDDNVTWLRKVTAAVRHSNE